MYAETFSMAIIPPPAICLCQLHPPLAKKSRYRQK